MVDDERPEPYPTEAQVFALLDRCMTRPLHEYTQWAGLLPIEAVLYAVQDGRFTWHELFYAPEQTLAIAFDDWRDAFRGYDEDDDLDDD